MRKADGGQDATVEATPRRGLFVSALVAAFLLPLLAALLGMPPFDRADRFGFLPGVASSSEADEDQPDAAGDASDASDPTDDGTAADEVEDSGDTPDGEVADETTDTDHASPWGPVEHVLRISLCDGIACPLEDEHLDDLHQQLADDPEVLGFVYLDPQTTYEWLTSELEGLADRIDADRIAGMFHVTLVVGTDPERAVERYGRAGGVSDVAWLTEDLTPEALLTERGRLGFDEDSRQVAIHLCDDARCPAMTDDERAALDAALAEDPDVLDVTRDTVQQAHERFLEALPDAPDVTATVDPNQLPRPLRLTIGDDVDASDIVERYRVFDGVEDVIWERHDPG